jgi:Abnormal spindle-like microcephaly-assoc'd, ASPM-SPD-2-Hydin/Divergent InlB B-repeat domain
VLRPVAPLSHSSSFVHNVRRYLFAVLPLIASLLLSSCGGGGGGATPKRTDGGSSAPGGGAVKALAVNTPVPHKLTVQASPAAGGTVLSNPAGINCGSVCTSNFLSGGSVSLTVSPAAGYVFNGWSGSCSGSGPCLLKSDKDRSVTATFAAAPTKAQYALTVSLGAGGANSGSVTSADGSINCGGSCTSQYASGTTLTLTATPASGYAFAGWDSPYCSGLGTCTVSVTSDESVTANFIAVQPMFASVSGSANGGRIVSSPAGISCPTQCAANFDQGTTVTLTAVPYSGNSFNGWSGACSGTGICTITTTAAQSVNADFSASSKTVAAPFLSVASPFTFGSVASNTTSSQTIQITNSGLDSGGDLVITSASVDNSLFVIPTGQFPMTIAPGKSQNLTVSFTPTANGPSTGIVTFASNASNSPTTLILSGNGSTTTGSGSGSLNATPTMLFFGNVNVGQKATVTVVLANPGTASTIVSAATVTGNGLTISSPAFPLTLAAGSKHSVTITFEPQSTGPITGVITFTSNSSSPVVSIIASANASSPTTSVTVFPATLNFGLVPFATTFYQNVTLYNTGNTPVTINNATVTGSGFSIVSGTTPTSIPVFGSQAFTLLFTAPAIGTATGSVNFDTTAPDPQPSVGLSGTGVAVSTHSATLSWTASTSPVGTPQVIGYNIYRSPTSGGGYQLVSFTSSRSFVDSSATSGQIYYWVVTAVNSGGTESIYSNEVSASIP